MSRERFEELKVAYSLGALPDAERRELDGHLTLYPELRAEVEELNSVANTLALSPAEYEPSPQVRQNLMHTVNSEAQAGQPGQTSALSRLRDYISFRTLAPAALAAAVVALLGWAILLQAEVQDLQGEVQNLQGELQERQTFAMEGSGAASNTDAEVVRLENGRSVVVADDMPAPPDGKTMQIWVIQGDTPQPAGTFSPGGPDSGTVAASVDGSLEKADAVAITVEPAGGSEQPTSDPVLQASVGT